MIQGYLTAIAAWPVTLSLIGLSAGMALYTRSRGGVPVVLFMLVVIAAWQFECDM